MESDYKSYNLDYKFCADYETVYNEYIKLKKNIIYVNQTISTISRNGFSEINSVETYKEYKKISLLINYNYLKKMYFFYKINERKMINIFKNLIQYKNV